MVTDEQFLELRSEVGRQRDAIADLREELRELRASLASGITTNDLRIVDDDGQERIVLYAASDEASIGLRAFGGVERDDATMIMQLIARDPAGEEPARVYGASFVAGRDLSVNSFGYASEFDGVADIESLLT